MSETKKVQGFVGKVFEKKGQSKKTGREYVKYSVLLEEDGQEVWYGAGFDRPGFKEGDCISFEAEKSKYGNGYDIVKGTGKIVKNPPPRQEVQKDSKGGNKYNSDASRADRAYHAARGSAIEVVTLAVQGNGTASGLKLAKGKEAANLKLILDAIDKLTVQYFRDEFAEGFDDQFRLLGKVEDSGDLPEKDAGEIPDAVAEDDTEYPDIPEEDDSDIVEDNNDF